MMTRTFIFAGGGTGGHLYPGVAISRELDRLAAASGLHARSLFVCSDRPLDARILEAERVEFVPLGARPFSVRPRALVRFMWTWGRSVREARTLIRSEVERAGERGAVEVVAMGGFVAAPIVQAARVEKVAVSLVNLDAVPGKANRLIASRARRVFTSARLIAGYAGQGWTIVSPIVRREAIAPGTPAHCRARLGLDPDRRTLLVTGGSQGAQSINQLMHALAKDRPALLNASAAPAPGDGPPRAWQVLHQCGKADADSLSAAYHAAGIRASVQAYANDMGDWWGAADLCVARCGAGNVAEAWANRVPCVFLPYPFHRDEHQKHNAAAMVERGAALIVRDQIEARRTMPEFEHAITPLLTDPAALEAMSARARSLGPAAGATEVAHALLRTA